MYSDVQYRDHACQLMTIVALRFVFPSALHPDTVRRISTHPLKAMMRRFSPVVARNALATPTVRSFFYPGGGETGISQASSFRMLGIIWAGIVFTCIGTYRLVFFRYSTKRQLVGDSTDLWADDGTEMEGEEAVANLRIHHERIMPFMNAIQEKVEASQ